MTWDVYALRPPRGARTVDEISDEYVSPPIGEPEDVVAAVRGVAPHVDAGDPRWLRIDGPDHHIEVAIGKGIRVHDVTFYITGDGDGAVPIVLDVCRALGIVPFDTETGRVLDSGSRPPVDVPPDDDDEDEPRPWWRRLFGR